MLESLWTVAFVYTLLRMREQIRKIELDDPQVRALRDLPEGYEHLRRGSYTPALISCTQHLHRRGPSTDVAYWLRATARLGLHQYEQSVEDCNEALARNIYLTGAYRIRGLAYYALQEYARALDNLEYAVRLGDVHPEVYEMRADILYRLGESEQAAREEARAQALALRNT
jgi:tetratricopeptide (TPR) repeat protein